MHMQNLVKFHQFFLKILSRNEILTSIKGHNSVINLKRNNPKLDLVNIKAYAKFGQIPSICSQDIERKGNPESWHDGQPENSIPPILCMWAGGGGVRVGKGVLRTYQHTVISTILPPDSLLLNLLG